MPSNDPKVFTQTYDKATRILSTVVCVLFVGLYIVTRSNAVAIIEALVLAVSYAYSPKSFSLSGQTIIVKRLVGKVRIPLTDIRELRVATGEELTGCVRLWASGGLFGYYGLFRMQKLGNCRWYLTNRQRAVVVSTSERTVLLSPDDVEGFIASVRASVPIAEVSPNESTLDLPQSNRPNAGMAKVVGSSIAAVVIAVVAIAMLYSPGPPSYTLTADSMTIKDRFYPVIVQANSVDVGGIRVVDIAGDSAWRPTARTNGFANLNYHSGWFQVGDGKSARMYWADTKRLVLLPPKGVGPAVLLQTSNPDKFVEQLRQLWSGSSS